MIDRVARSGRLKLWLVVAMAVGGLTSFSVPRVYAILTAETSQTPATATSGTLVMDLRVNNGATACYSYNGTDNLNTGCSSLYADTASTELYPGTPVTTQVKITNTGTLDASDLRLYMPGGCSPAKTGDAPSQGAGNPCAAGGMQVYVQETDAGGTATRCWLGTGSPTCSFSTDLATLAGATTPSTGVDLGAGPPAGQSRYFTIGIQLPTTVDNTYQGAAASFVLGWHLRS